MEFMTWDPCEMASPNLRALKGWDRMDWPQMKWYLGLGTPSKWQVPTSMLSTAGIAQIGLKWTRTLDLEPMRNGKSSFHALNGWDCTNDLKWMGLRTWDPMWNGKSQLPCPQRLRPHILTSNKMGLRTLVPREVASPNFHALNGCDRANWPQTKWDLGLGT